MKLIINRILEIILVGIIVIGVVKVVIPNKDNMLYQTEIEPLQEEIITKEKENTYSETVDLNSDIWQLAISYIGQSGMCETVATNFVKEYLGVQVITDVNTIDVSYENAQPGDYVIYDYGHQGVYLGEDLFLNPNTSGTTVISNIWNYGTPSFKHYNGEKVICSCLDATSVGYGYQSLNDTKGCYDTDNITNKFYYIKELKAWTNDLNIVDEYGYVRQ